MIVGNKVILRDKELADARDDYAWETDAELARLDAVSPAAITFSRYLAEHTNELRNPLSTSRRFAVDTLEGKHIGNCSYYNISDSRREAELGILIGNRDYWDKGYGTDAVATLANHIFSQTSLDRIYLKTVETNLRAQKCFRKYGFTFCGHLARDGYRFVLMDIHRSLWLERQPKP